MQGRILFIDDEPFYATKYIDALKKAGYEVHLCDSADGGLEDLRNQIDDLKLVVLDFMMPTPSCASAAETTDGVATGRWFLRQARHLIKEHDLPVIVLTNRTPEGVAAIMREDDIGTGDLFQVRSKEQTPALSLPKIVGKLIR